MSASVRAGILGGTFDPIHCGHLDLAEAACRALRLDRVLLMPAHLPPHRPLRPRASPYHRFAMVALAVAGRSGLLASDAELRAAGWSYTATTLERLHHRGFRPTQLFFITGADAFAEIATWRNYPGILAAAHHVVVSRPGWPAPALRERLPDLSERMVAVPGHGKTQTPGDLEPALARIFLVDAPTADVSSTGIRSAIEAGAPIAGLVPPAVERHIQQHRLYSAVPEAADPLHGEE